MNINNWGLGISFGAKHSWRDFGLYLVDKNIAYPQPKTQYVQVGGRSGSLDLSLALTGFVQYEDREMEFTFAAKADRKEQADIMNNISNYLHGQKMAIVDDVEQDYYYLGRCEIIDRTFFRSVLQIKIKAVCEPYKYKQSRYFDVRFLGNTYTDNMVDVDNYRRNRDYRRSGNVFINEDGSETNIPNMRISYFIPIHGDEELWAVNEIDSSDETLRSFYIAEYDIDFNFIRRSPVQTYSNLVWETAENCRFVAMGYGARSLPVGGIIGKPCLQYYNGNNVYADYDKTEKTDHLTAFLETKEAVPTICINGEITFYYGDEEETFTSGVYQTPFFTLLTGSNNDIEITGHGSAAIIVGEVSL